MHMHLTHPLGKRVGWIQMLMKVACGATREAIRGPTEVSSVSCNSISGKNPYCNTCSFERTKRTNRLQTSPRCSPKSSDSSNVSGLSTHACTEGIIEGRC